MKPLYGLENLKKEKIRDPVLTLGSFDGFHRGHQAILDSVIKKAKENKRKCIAFTFDPHPQEVLSPGRPSFLLTTTDEKVSILQDSALDFLLVHPFNLEIASIEPEVFIEKILLQEIGVSEVIIGYDHRFGKNRRGDYQLLQKYSEKKGYRVEVVDPVNINGAPISATRIRKAISEGRFREVTELIGRPYFFSGTVVKGSMRGKDLGVPTANLQVSSPKKLLPPKGVYTVHVMMTEEFRISNTERRISNVYGGMMNIGTRPTFGEKDLTIEVHLFDFTGDLYGENLTVSVIEKIRDELTLSSAEELKEWMRKDEEIARKTLEEMYDSSSGSR